jgi:Glycosyl-4,4'-diaponeurosporenoate acyltransferase
MIADTRRRLGLVVYMFGAIGMAGLLIFCWLKRGPDHPVYGILVASWTLVVGPLIATPAVQRIPRHWFRVSESEAWFHRLLGVGFFRPLLVRSGWERFVHQRIFRPTKDGLLPLEFSLRANASAHGTCFVIHLVLAVLILLVGHRWGALWILLSGVFVHFYPVLLQRSIMLQLQPLLSRARFQNAGINRSDEIGR